MCTVPTLIHSVGGDPKRNTWAYRGKGGWCCSLHAHLSPTFVVFPLHSSLQAFTHAPQSSAELGELTATQGNLWELKNPYISTCALHIAQCDLTPSNPHQPFVSAAHLDVFLHHLMVFPGHNLVCIYLTSFLFLFLSISSSLTQISLRRNIRDTKGGGG